MKRIYILLLLGLMACKKKDATPTPRPEPVPPVSNETEIKIRVIGYGSDPKIKVLWEYDDFVQIYDSVYTCKGERFLVKKIKSDTLRVQPVGYDPVTKLTATYDYTVYANSVEIGKRIADKGTSSFYKVR